MALRRMRAARIRRRSTTVWPILPCAAQRPTDWAGWPERKKFGVVLTHDVEGPLGLAKCRALAELEMSLGFRSSFNFVPEGTYAVTAEFRAWLLANGFEVGVHDLHHDGSLYRSREDFVAQAARINHHLKAWGASGFRAGFMFHNLEWLHELEVQYDASTFDTDPFEPQADGVGTIFPFWVGRKDGGGYVELPYTLPQDSSLFLIFREPTPAIWLQKTDWLAQHGGMVLVNVHPDYLCFGSRCHAAEFPVEHYRALLEHVKTSFAGEYWHGLPRELAAWYRNRRAAPQPVAAAISA